MRHISTLSAVLFLSATLFGCSSASDSAERAMGLPNSNGGGQAAEWAGSHDASSSGPAMSEPMVGDVEPNDPDPIEDPNSPNEGDNFEPVGTNPFVVASSDPWSTFAADVDTASYDIFRRDIGEYNDLPQPASVRLEEYVNYFDYAYEAPDADAGVPFSVSLEAAPSPFVAGTTVVRVGIQGTPLENVEEKDANVVFLIDSSGSMKNGSKMPLVQKVLTEALDVLQPTDLVSVVTYAGGAGVVLEPTPASSKGVIADVINSLSAGGGTNGAGGIHAAYEQAESTFIEGGINHVIMCTDGDFNVGVSSTDALVDLIIEKRETGITLTALGFGSGNYNDIMMEKVSNAGNGTYSLVTDEDDAVAYANNKLLSSMYFIAKDMKIQTTFNPATVHAYRLLGYEINDIPDELFTDDTIDAGEIGAGHSVTALYEVVMSGQEIPLPEGAPEPEDGEAFEGEISVMPEELVRVEVRFKDVDATVDDAAHQVAVGLTPDQVLTDLDAASDDFRWAAAVAAFAEILKDSPYADANNLEAIDSIVASDPKTGFDREEFELLYGKAKTQLGF